VAARVAEAEVAEERRREDVRQAERETLRSIEVRSERVVERSFAETRERRGAERIRVDEAVTSEHAGRRSQLMVDAYVELILPRVGDRRRRVDGRAGHVRIGDERNDGGADRVPAIAWNHPLPLRVAAELGAPRCEGIDDRRIAGAGLRVRRRALPPARRAVEVADR